MFPDKQLFGSGFKGIEKIKPLFSEFSTYVKSLMDIFNFHLNAH